MKLRTKIAISSIILALIAIIFVLSCIAVYHHNLNLTAYWWSWIGATWLIDVAVGAYIFAKRKISDETKTFWLFTIVIFPIAGAFAALIFIFKLQTQYSEPNNNHSLMLATIFNARQSIKIYSSSFLVPLDIFKALNMASFKDVKVEIIISVNEKPRKQKFLEWKLKKCLEKDVKVYFTNKQSDDSFIIIDDKYVLSANQNFNYAHIFKERYVQLSNNVQACENAWNEYRLKASEFDFVNLNISRSKKVHYKLVNIFCAFF